MKKILTLFYAGVLMSILCAGLVACNEPKEPEAVGVVLPVSESDVPEDVAAFLTEQLGPSLSDYFSREDGDYEPVLLTINSNKELKAVVPSTKLPDIDFDKYTLVILQYYTTGGLYLKSQAIDTDPNAMIMNLVFGNTGNGLGAMFSNYYCNLYPKLPQKSIEIHTTTIKEY